MIKMMLKRAFRTLGYNIVKYAPEEEFPTDFTKEEIDTFQAVLPYTMTSQERIVTLIRAVRYVVENDIPGDIVECGVWKGGSMMAIARTLKSLGVTDRKLYLFDTFEGMPMPTDLDVNVRNEVATSKFEQTKISDVSSDWCYAPLDAVKEAITSTGYDPARLHFIKGKVEDTLPENAPAEIALLRLDTDWYESTKHELETLYPSLVRGGVLVLDDYAHWKGCRKAVDEYIAEHKLKIMLNRIDATGVSAVKL